MIFPDLELSHVSKIEAIYETMKGVAHDYLHEVCAADYKEKTNPRGILAVVCVRWYGTR